MSCKLAKHLTLPADPEPDDGLDLPALAAAYPASYATAYQSALAREYARGFDAGRQAERQAREDEGKWGVLVESKDGGLVVDAGD